MNTKNILRHNRAVQFSETIDQVRRLALSGQDLFEQRVKPTGRMAPALCRLAGYDRKMSPFAYTLRYAGGL